MVVGKAVGSIVVICEPVRCCGCYCGGVGVSNN